MSISTLPVFSTAADGSDLLIGCVVVADGRIVALVSHFDEADANFDGDVTLSEGVIDFVFGSGAWTRSMFMAEATRTVLNDVASPDGTINPDDARSLQVSTFISAFSESFNQFVVGPYLNFLTGLVTGPIIDEVVAGITSNGAVQFILTEIGEELLSDFNSDALDLITGGNETYDSLVIDYERLDGSFVSTLQDPSVLTDVTTQVSISQSGNLGVQAGARTTSLEGGPGEDLLVLDYSNGVLGDDRGIAEVQLNLDQDNGFYGGNDYVFMDEGERYRMNLDGFERFDITGSSGNDNITTSAGDDVINGGEGNDRLEGVGGADTLIGGAGDDHFFFRDTYFADGGAGLVINGGTGLDYVQFSGTQSGYALILEDISIDLISGTASGAFNWTGVEEFSGSLGSGNDTLIAGAQVFSLEGGAGEDLLVLDYSNGVLGDDRGIAEVQLNLDQDNGFYGGNDYVFMDEGERYGTNLDGFERFDITGSSGNDNITTSAGDDVINGGEGNDRLEGVGGADTLIGGAGDDHFFFRDTYFANGGEGLVINGGSGLDYVQFYASSGNQAGYALILEDTSIDLISGTASGAFNWTGVEEFSGSLGSGNDTLIAGAQVFSLEGGAGEDLLVLDYSNGVLGDNRGIAQVQLNLDQDNGFYGGNDRVFMDEGESYRMNLDGFERFDITGSSGNDNITTSAGDDVINLLGGNDQYSGGLGADEVLGSSGSDTILGDGGNDTISGGLHADLLLGGDGNDVISGGHDAAADTIDGGTGSDLIGGGGGDDVLSGGNHEDVVSGGEGDDTIDGGQGSDTLAGGAGNDSLDGGDGFDVLIGGLGQDTLFGNIGDDRINGNGNLDTIHGEIGDDVLAGGLGRDSVNGGAGNDSILGNDGNDTLLGGAGNDTILGNTGNDLMAGGSGHDVLIGGVGNDRMLGQIGRDVINSGGGSDTISGGADSDRFVFVAAFGNDWITDFEEDFDNVVLGGFTPANVTVTNVDSDIVLQVAGGGNIRIVDGVTDNFDVGTDVLFI